MRTLLPPNFFIFRNAPKLKTQNAAMTTFYPYHTHCDEMLQKFLREGAQTPEFTNRPRTEDAFWEDYYQNIHRVLGTVFSCEPVILLHAAELMTWFQYFG